VEDEMNETVVMESLVGKHVLTGVDEINRKIEDYSRSLQDCQCINFILDGITYTAIENPDDGYRSMLDKIIVSDESITNIFNPVRVVVSVITKSKEYDNECEILDFVDMVNGKTIMEIGTYNSDDYYPSFVANWIPENMSVNEGNHD
jgi:hypothetical protein